MTLLDSMPLVDEETRRLLLKKTWCHGQSILPLYSVYLLFRWLSTGYPLPLLLGACVLPVWSFFSYRSVVAIDNEGGSRKLPYRNVCVFGVVAMMTHLSIFIYVRGNLSEKGNMLMLVASGLFLIETCAFLLVVTALRSEISEGAEGPLLGGDGIC